MPGVDHRITGFSFRRQALDGRAADALEAVRAAVGVYSSMPSGPLSIRVRAAGVDAEAVRALERDGRVVRMRAMRTSAFLVPLADAARYGAATSVPASRFNWLLRAAGVAEDELSAVRCAVSRAAAQPGTLAEIRVRLAASGAGGTAAPWTQGAALGRVLSLLTATGDLAAIGTESLSSNALRYVDRRTWLEGAAADDGLSGEPERDDADREAARAWLAGEYLRSYGPVRVEDLAWWAGWSRAATAAAIGAHETVDVGAGLRLRAADVRAFEAAAPLFDAITLLPKWDAWTMGYPLDGRERFLDMDVHDRVFDGDGNGLGMVLRAGRAIGAWTHRGAGTAMQADLDLFEAVPSRVRDRIEGELTAIAAFLGYRRAVVRDVASVMPNRRRQRRPFGDGG